MKKLLALLLVCMFVSVFTVPSYAAGSVIWTKDTTLSNMRNIYNEATVKAGVTVTLHDWKPDPQGLEIAKRLTVENGGKIVGGCIVFSRGAVCEGLPLYYIAGGEEKLLKATLSELAALFPQDDYCPTFWYVSKTGHYVLHGNSFDGDPFELPAPDDRGGERASTADPYSEQTAEALRSLGLFKGTGTNADGRPNFELGRSPTRVEEVVMLIRMLGKEGEALAGDWTHPFDDVPVWADPYVGYAYEHSLASGVSAASFGTSVPATAQMFATFVLRAMGYTDDTRGGSDFSYSEATAFAMEKGIIAGSGDIDGFDRAACVRIMANALRQKRNGGELMWQFLSDQGVFSEEAYRAAFNV